MVVSNSRCGDELLDLVRARGHRSLFVVGTGKNVGKTVAVRAICDAVARRSLPFGLTSLGRDGEAVDAADALAKPRLPLSPGAVLATARDLLPPSPAVEFLELTDVPTAAGPLAYVRVRAHAEYEIAGPPTASAIRTAVERLCEHGVEQTIVDGAIDRVAAVAGGRDAIVVSAGAAAAATMADAVAEIAALVRRLTVPRVDPDRAAIRLPGALTASLAAQLAREARDAQVVVRDPTQIAIAGGALLGVLDRLDVRCERPLNVVAATVASIGRNVYFEPAEFLTAVAHAIALPTFDVYAAKVAA